jgi:hypothetical protein
MVQVVDFLLCKCISLEFKPPWEERERKGGREERKEGREGGREGGREEGRKGGR